MTVLSHCRVPHCLISGIALPCIECRIALSRIALSCVESQCHVLNTGYWGQKYGFWCGLVPGLSGGVCAGTGPGYRGLGLSAWLGVGTGTRYRN